MMMMMTMIMMMMIMMMMRMMTIIIMTILECSVSLSFVASAWAAETSNTTPADATVQICRFPSRYHERTSAATASMLVSRVT